MQTKLKTWIHWQPDEQAFLEPLTLMEPWAVSLDSFHRGIDNTNIDVSLSPRFLARSRELIDRMIAQDVSLNYWGETGREPSTSDVESFRDAYLGLMEVAVEQARKSARLEWIRLLQLTLVKHFLATVRLGVERLRDQLKKNQGMETQTSGKALELHQRAVSLAKHKQAIIYRVTRRLFRLVQKIESTNLRKLRKSVLGVSWPVSREALFNPLLHLPSLSSDEQWINHYPIFFAERDGNSQLYQVNKLVTEVFGDYLPDWARAPALPADSPDPLSGDSQQFSETSRIRIQERRDQGGLSGFLEVERILGRLMKEAEYRHPRFSWLDVPENMDLFAFSADPLRSFKLERRVRQSLSPWTQRQWPEFQRRMMQKLFRGFERAGVIREVMASYRTLRIFREFEGKVPPRVIFEYLAGLISKRDLTRKLGSIQGELDTSSIIKKLDQLAGVIRRISSETQEKYLTRIVRDFLVVRRDLKVAFRTHQLMDQIRLMADPEDIVLSKTNDTLHEFLLRDELETADKRVLNHVIIKADLRGSTEVISQLLAKKLNPASHFSLNFFGPVSKLLDAYGATKTFVEGDAIILTIFEYEGESYQWLSVAHACGLAQKILKVMEAQNAQNRKNGLPELELGLGIAFGSDAPSYLYDGDQKIMITPAISRADKLSSCSPFLRRALRQKGIKENGVEVAVAGDSWEYADVTDEFLRYNVNGIELDAPAFFKLKSELALRRLGSGGKADADVYYVGRYPDTNGTINWLAVREAPIRVWDEFGLGANEASGRRFYEVVVDPRKIDQLKQKVRVKASEQGSGIRG